MTGRLGSGYEPRFDIDYERGRQGELFVESIIDGLKTESIEVKRDARSKDTGNVYIEYECKKGGVYVPSGIATTTSEFWAFVIADGDVMVVLPIENLKRLSRKALKGGQVAEQIHGSHPTKGVLVRVIDLVKP